MTQHCAAATSIHSQTYGATAHLNNLNQDTVMGCALRLLCPQNADLIKLLLRDCLANQYSEKELTQLELRRNMNEDGLLDCYGFGIAEIKTRCNHIWEKTVQLPGTSQEASRYIASKRDNTLQHPDAFLYWTFIYILRDGAENPYPFTLYKMILSRRLEKYYHICSSSM